MRFEKLRLVGFKSFVEPTDFIIERGLTGVVGPNGCGKSNLVEALRWVMGESSYKSMRASAMDDVIFSGSATRPSRNSAEVALFLDNADRNAPAAFNESDEVHVSRRIEREAGSAYKISGKDARAKDVQLLFADSSTGARSPSMVGQGRIGELIQAKPQARRALLEEAAGISGLHSRRHEAELRLRSAETNLERLDDVVAELESQIESLKRQARQASRFKNLSKEIRQTEATVLHLKWTSAKSTEAETNSELSQATAAVAERSKVQMEAARAQAIAQHVLPTLRQAEAEAAAALQRLNIARDQLDAEVEKLSARRREQLNRVEQLKSDIAREAQLLKDAEDAAGRLTKEKAELEANDSGADARTEELRVAAEEARAHLVAAEAKLSDFTAESAEASALRTQLNRRKSEMIQRIERFEQRKSEVGRELAAIAEKIRSLPDPAAHAQSVTAADERVKEAERAVQNAENSTANAREAERTIRPSVQEKRSDLNALEAEARTLANLLNAGRSDLFPAIIESITVTKGYETALGAALGDDLEISTDEGAAAHWRGSASTADDPELPEGIASLADYVDGAGALERRLRQIGIVVDVATGDRLSTGLKVGQRLVTRDGHLWRWDGLRVAADAPTAAAQRLAQKNRLAELDSEIAEKRTSLSEIEADLATAERKITEASASEKQARESLRKSQGEARDAREKLADAERQAGGYAQKRAILEEQLSSVSNDLVDAEKLIIEVDAAIDAEPDLTALNAKLESQKAVVSQLRGVLAEATATYEGLTREQKFRRDRVQSISNDLTTWERRKLNSHAQIETLTSRRDEAERTAAELDGGPEELQVKKRALIKEIEAAESVRKAAADKLALAETDARTADRMATDCITDLSETREARARIEERLVAAKQRRSDIEARIVETFNKEPHTIFGLTGLGPDDELPNLSPLEKKLERLKVDRERLGAVNLRAEEEQVDLVERRDEIVNEREDVIEAIRELRSGISSLNREGRERLLVAFEDVQVHFKRLFTHLFGGGTAELQLVENDDPLEAGLEIIARPPGKKPQTMTLLSGGEQALTAMALIFAVFLTNPAPICVLDEVDAPLDDANVERFCDLMDEMTRQTETRFVIITHNPITMARMDRLFGVTMAEQGVSQLVSVDLREAEEIREAS
ncbi:MAG: chromosome segregation protein SMC [Pseudomonadota bacterium]